MGGWACLVIYGEYTEELSGWEANVTNNRMELRAVIEGFKHILREYDRPMRVVVISDSNYVVKAMQEQWPVKWDYRNWRTASGELVKNRDLWEELQEITAPFPVTWTHIHGHRGDELNDRADELAVAAREMGAAIAKEVEAQNAL